MKQSSPRSHQKKLSLIAEEEDENCLLTGSPNARQSGEMSKLDQVLTAGEEFSESGGRVEEYIPQPRVPLGTREGSNSEASFEPELSPSSHFTRSLPPSIMPSVPPSLYPTSGKTHTRPTSYSSGIGVNTPGMTSIPPNSVAGTILTSQSLQCQEGNSLDPKSPSPRCLHTRTFRDPAAIRENLARNIYSETQADGCSTGKEVNTCVDVTRIVNNSDTKEDSSELPYKVYVHRNTCNKLNKHISWYYPKFSTDLLVQHSVKFINHIPGQHKNWKYHSSSNIKPFSLRKIPFPSFSNHNRKWQASHSPSKPSTLKSVCERWCPLFRKSYSVWSTVLVVWVLTLMLITDLQWYGAGGASKQPPQLHQEMVSLNDTRDYPTIMEEHLRTTQDPNLSNGLYQSRREQYVTDDTVTSQPTDEPYSTSESFSTNSTGLQQVVSVESRVSVQVFYEALCPDSKVFIRSQLAPAMEKIADRIELSLIPYGKATTLESGGSISFRCQHGTPECQANKVHACVLRYVKDTALQTKIVSCMIADNRRAKKVGQRCMNKYAGPGSWEPVQLCYNSDEGNQLLKHMGSLTHSLSPSLSYVPTVTLNGSQDGMFNVLNNFLSYVCRNLKGSLPAACM